MAEHVIQSYLDTSFDQGGYAVQVVMTPEEHHALFQRIQAQWTRYGESEPFASVLSSTDFLKDNIQASMPVLEASGLEVVRRLRVLAQRNGVALPRGTCLELGCGVGRITRPLAPLFDRILAADISPGNLAVCQRYVAEAGAQHVEPLLLQTPGQIAGMAPLDAFVSVIVLQHNPPPVQYYLLDNILAKLKPGGIAFFQAATFNPAYGYQIGQHLAMDTATFEGWSLHCLPMQHILRLLRTHGLELLEVVEDGQTGGLQNRFHSHTFFARKM